MNVSDPVIDWQALERLRDAFLKGTAGATDYWESERDLASYDATFAQRIGWKWDFVLADLARRGWTPPPGELVDWGCGSGVAGRAFLDHFGSTRTTALRLVDRSALALAYAARRAGQRFPGLRVLRGAPEPPPPGGTPAPARVVLLSHLLTELAPVQTEALLEELRAATSILWVEPGTYAASLALIAVRERLRDQFHPVAPCPHRGPCGILAAGNEPHWCHHFARPPGGVFTDPFWGRFANLLQIDLRSLPVSYLVLDRNPPTPLPADTVRTLGRPRVYKAELRVLACAPEGVREHPLPKRQHPAAYRQARKDRFASLQVWSRSEGRITGVTGLGDAETGAEAGSEGADSG